MAKTKKTETNLDSDFIEDSYCRTDATLDQYKPDSCVNALLKCHLKKDCIYLQTNCIKQQRFFFFTKCYGKPASDMLSCFFLSYWDIKQETSASGLLSKHNEYYRIY